MKRLNKNGLEKALPLIEEVLGINGKLKIDGNNLLLDEFRLSIDIPDDWVVTEMDVGGMSADGPVGSNPDPSGYVPATAGIGEKERNTNVKELGRAAVERKKGEDKQKAVDLAKKVVDKFVSKPEFDKYIKDLEDRTLDAKDLQVAFQKFGDLLARRH
jgi:hypothetical protein